MRIWKTMCAALLLLLLLGAHALAVPSPSKEFYYLDEANVLSEETKGIIFFSNQLLEKECGAQIVVVTVDTTRPSSIADFSNELFNIWQIGDKKKNNGFLMVMAIGDDDYYSLCGADLQPKFTSSALKDFFDQYLEVYFAAKDYDTGARVFYEAVFDRIADTYDAHVTVNDGVEAYEAWKAKANPEPLSARGGGGSFGGYDSREGYDDDRPDSFNIVLAALVLILLVVFVRMLFRRPRVGGVYTAAPRSVFFFGGSPWRRMPPRGPGPGMRPGPGPGPGGFRTGPSGPTSRPSGRSFGGGSLFGSGRSSGGGSIFGSGRSSGGRSSFGGGFGSARGGGGFTRGGGAGRGRH